jgi:rare lipoprotein A
MALLAAMFIAGCASPFKSQPDASPSGSAPAGSGRYYLDDGPGERPIAELEALPDAVPRSEPLHRFANRPYVVLGRSYQPMTRLEPFRERGTATWYGRRYHDRPTSTGERYDMYAMTAAHTRLPLPSYARVTNLRNGRTVVVRVNDRGPFLHGRVIDLSYAAAARLGFARAGSAEVEVELITDPEAPTVSEAGTPKVPAPSETPRPGVAPSTAVAAPPVVVSEPARSMSAAVSEPVAVPARDPHIVQVGSYSSRDTADAARRAIEARLGSAGHPLWVRQDGRLFRVIMGPFESAEQSRAVVTRIRSETGIDAFARPL